MISWFPSGNREINLKQWYPVQIPLETKFVCEVVNVLFDKSISPRKTEVVMKNRKSKAMM